MRPLSIAVVSGLAMMAATLSGCGSDNGASGISTASLLDGKSGTVSAGNGEVAAIRNDDPSAKPVQVAWTSARAQRCGFNFDPAKLKANYLASEARAGAPPAQMAAIEKAYDSALVNVSANIKGDPNYCTEKKSATIKSDLQRHLAGDYAPNLPQQKKVAEGFWDGLKSDEPPEAFDAKNFWADQLAKQNGAKGAQKSPE